MQGALERAYAHGAADAGDGARQYKQAALDQVTEQQNRLREILDSGNMEGAEAALEAARAARALRREEAAGRSSAPTASEGIASKKEDTQPSYFEQPNNSPGAAR